MQPVSSELDPRPTLSRDAQFFYQQGWMWGTAGNLSARSPQGGFWITASGRSKGTLTPADFVYIDPQGQPDSHPANFKPSAETRIHQVLYQLFPDAAACYHVHSVEANLVSCLARGDRLPLPAIEMLKGLGIWEAKPNCGLPIFANHFEVAQIAADIEQRFQTELPQVPVLLVRDHGITVWAASQETARNYVEVTEYLFRYLISAYQLGLWQPEGPEQIR